MLIKHEDTKISNVRQMLRTYFLQSNVREITTIESYVQKDTIHSALGQGYIEAEYHGNDALYRITPTGKWYRDTKCD